MRFSSLAVATLVSAAQAIDVQVVSVGKNPANNATGNQFWPDSIQAQPGSMVQFQFWAGNHTVTQSSFDSPCTPMEATMASNATSNSTAMTGGIKSGYQPVDASMAEGMIPTYTVWINDTQPLWFYCAQGTHCQGGMAMAINADDTSENTLESYKTAAAAVGGGGSGEGGGDTGSGGGSGESGDGSGDEVPGGDADAGTIGDPGSMASGLGLPGTLMLLVGTVVALV